MAIIHCDGILLRKLISLNHRLFLTEWSSRTIPKRNHSPTFKKPLKKTRDTASLENQTY